MSKWHIVDEQVCLKFLRRSDERRKNMLSWLRDFTRKLRSGADASVETRKLLAELLQTQLWETIGRTPRFQDPLRLLSSGYKVYSQSHEDGIIAEIFRRIGTSSRRFIEFGVGDGLECNSTLLLLQGWKGAWIDGFEPNAIAARKHLRDNPLEIVASYINVENADDLITRLAVGEELDMLSIDIDSIDYWVWQAIKTVKPRLVVIEYNATLPPSLSVTVPDVPDLRWNGSNYFGASLGALEKLGRAKGYALVGCTPSGVNAFFVRNDLVGDKFCSPFTAENHYEPPRYALSGPSGHRPGFGSWVNV
jgi:hypothetical protein